jgi:hypothetical protein
VLYKLAPTSPVNLLWTPLIHSALLDCSARTKFSDSSCTKITQHKISLPFPHTLVQFYKCAKVSARVMLGLARCFGPSAPGRQAGQDPLAPGQGKPGLVISPGGRVIPRGVSCCPRSPAGPSTRAFARSFPSDPVLGGKGEDSAIGDSR